jgi:ribosomal-protein-alanine N-acetyltransferase
LTQLQGGLSIGVVAPLEELRPEEPERILGGVFLQDRSDAWEIAMLWLSPECRGRGLMRSLVTGLQNGQWLSLSSRRWWLEVHADNQAALGLYEGLGFRTTGRRRGYYGPGADAILMEWQALP